MVRAWYIKDEDLDVTLLDKGDVKEFIDAEILKSSTGVETKEIPPIIEDVEKYLNTIKAARGFAYDDTLEITDSEDLCDKMKKFATEHLHEEDEIRFVLDGCVYLDVRSKADSWIRVEITKGDLIILPAGLYHRLTLDGNKFVTLRRLFYTKPIWTSHNRPADNLECRQKYLQSLST